VHYPLAEGKQPPPLEPGFYRPLSRIRLPEDSRFVAGFVHPECNEEEHLQLRDIIDEVRGQPVDVAASCGLGRMEPDQAEYVMRMMAALTA
jgi:Zn ribbon nucleic-acid-binding protein